MLEPIPENNEYSSEYQAGNSRPTSPVLVPDGTLRERLRLILYSVGYGAYIPLVQILMIVYGAIYLDKAYCPASPIAMLMLVGGIGLTFNAIFESYKRYRRETMDFDSVSAHNIITLVSIAFYIFAFVWYGFCVVNVFRLWGKVSYDPKTSHYCHPALMRFSFWVTLLPLCIGAAIVILFTIVRILMSRERRTS